MAERGVIVLAVYRPDPALLKRQVQSIIDQSLEEWRCIVGIDGPDEVASSLVRDAIGVDARFEVVRFPENVGIYLHFERLLALVERDTPWIALADQDDYWHEAKLEALVSRLEAEGTSGASCQARLTSESGVELGRTARRARPLVPLLIVNEVTGCLSIFKFEVLALALPFPPTSRLAIHDHWLGVCAMSLRGFHFMDSVLHDYVQHAGNAIGERKIRSIPRALADLLRGRVSWSEITEHPWQWRVTMARALNERISLMESPELEAIAKGTLTARLLRLLVSQVWTRQIPTRVAAGLALAAARRSRL